jgi:hypothetical protein
MPGEESLCGTQQIATWRITVDMPATASCAATGVQGGTYDPTLVRAQLGAGITSGRALKDTDRSGASEEMRVR